MELLGRSTTIHPQSAQSTRRLACRCLQTTSRAFRRPGLRPNSSRRGSLAYRAVLHQNKITHRVEANG